MLEIKCSVGNILHRCEYSTANKAGPSKFQEILSSLNYFLVFNVSLLHSLLTDNIVHHLEYFLMFDVCSVLSLLLSYILFADLIYSSHHRCTAAALWIAWHLCDIYHCCSLYCDNLSECQDILKMWIRAKIVGEMTQKAFAFICDPVNSNMEIFTHYYNTHKQRFDICSTKMNNNNSAQRRRNKCLHRRLYWDKLQMVRQFLAITEINCKRYIKHLNWAWLMALLV